MGRRTSEDGFFLPLRQVIYFYGGDALGGWIADWVGVGLNRGRCTAAYRAWDHLQA